MSQPSSSQNLRVSGFGLDLDDFELVARPVEQGWELVTEHPQLSGRLRLPATEGAPIVLTLQRFRLPRDDQQLAAQGLI